LRVFFDRGENKGEKRGNLPWLQFLTDFNNFQEKCQAAGSSQVVVKKILIEGDIGGERGDVCPSRSFKRILIYFRRYVK